MKLKSIYLLLTIIICICFPILSWAQVIDPPPDPVDTPIDGGLSILLGAGVAYGIKKVRDSRKKQKEQQDI